LDSNVVVALISENHEHHGESFSLLAGDSLAPFAIAAHSFAEAYSTLTRRGEHASFRFEPGEAWAALESLRAATAIVGLTPAQTFDAIRRYAHSGGVGARLYDLLIGETAIAHGISTIVTWNTSHMRGLFPTLNVATPAQFKATHQASRRS
jgi:predicted nucleic acid-binding protein